MAKNRGIYTNFKGTLGGICFYDSLGERLVRRATGPSAATIKNDPRYRRVKENNKEFAGATFLSKAIREAIPQPYYQFKDGHMASRLTGRCRSLIALGSGKLGEREGSLTQHGNLLKEFSFHKTQLFSAQCRATITATATQDPPGIGITISKISKATIPNLPKNATHVAFTLANILVSDYAYNPITDQYEPKNPAQNSTATIVTSEPIPITTTAQNLQLQAANPKQQQAGQNTARLVFIGIQALNQESTNKFTTLQTNKAMKCLGIL